MTEPQPTISSKPPCTREDALQIVKRLRENGYIAYFAGGCVRDELLGIAPKDYDVATDAPPARVRELFKNTQAVGAAFGVILVRQGKSIVEVATFRTDDTYLDGRRPSSVHFTTAEEDAKRRDFTINGLFLDPIENKVIDYVGGRSDLAAKLLRAIGEPNLRFQEDHLRLLRAVRFAARFDLAIEPSTAEAIHLHADHLKRISPERIAEELRMSLTPAWRNQACRLLRQFNLDRVILRFAPDLKEPGQLFFAIDENSISFGGALAAFVLDYQPGKLLAREQIKRISAAMRQALKISNAENDELEGTLSFAHLLTGSTLGIATIKRFLAHPTAGLSMRIMAALQKTGFMTKQVETLLQKLHEVEKTDFAPLPLITGDDLVAAGFSPGKQFKQILNDIYDAQLESRISSKQEAMELAMKIAKAS